MFARGNDLGKGKAMKKTYSIVEVIVVVLVIWGSAYGGEYTDVTDLDGNTWKMLPKSWKFGFVHGFISGISVALSEAAPINKNINFLPEVVYYLDATTKTKKKWYIRACKFPAEKVEMYNITVDQLCEGIETFYKEYRNRNIEMVNAIYIVKAEIRGKDPGYIKAQTRWLRKPREEREELLQECLGKLLRPQPPGPCPNEYKAHDGKVYRLFDYAQ